LDSPETVTASLYRPPRSLAASFFQIERKKETYNAGWNPANCVAVMMVGPYRSTLGLLIKIMMTVDRNDVHGIVSTKQLSTIPLQGFKESSVDLCSAL